MSEIPEKQRAVFIEKTGGPEVLKYDEFPTPKVGEKDVLVRNTYAGLNFIDIYFRTSLYSADLPLVLGREGAGKVAAVGSKVTKFKVGQSVGYLASGAYAEYTAVNEDSAIFVLPDYVSERDWATAGLQLLTTEVLVQEGYPLKKGDIALIHAAAGGVGGLLVQAAKKIGATVIASTSSDEKVKLAKELGADYVINYKTEDIATRVKEITNGKGVNVSYDSVGKATYQASIDSLAIKGTYVPFGNASGPVPPIDVLEISKKAIRVIRPTLFVYLSVPGGLEHYSKSAFKTIGDGIKLRVYKEYDIKDYSEAITTLESGKTTGKLILKI